MVIVNFLIAPVVAIVAVAVAAWKGSDVTVTVCDPPTYPVPAESRLTVPRPFLNTTNALDE